MTTQLSLIAAPLLVPSGLPVVLNEQKLDDGSSFGHYNVTHLVNSPTNRKRFSQEKLEQLAASIKEKGVAQPILIRPLPVGADGITRFEIIAGERRWRASVIAGAARIPALCRDLSDHDAIELQILENLQREDPHPLEEAEGYERLMMKHGYSADQLVERLKKSRSYIYGRLKLCALSIEAREVFLDNQDALSASTALLIARIPVPELQNRALKEILAPDHRGEPMSYRAAAAHIARRYTLDLNEASFDTKDAKLLATAGNCTKCPKRAGNQPEIYPDAKSADVCTDPDCFEEKRAAHYQRIVVQANKRGIPVLGGAEAKAISSTTWQRDSEFVTDASHLSTFANVAPATGMSGYVIELLADGERPKPVKYVKHEDGEVDAVYRRSDVQVALEKKGICETQAVRDARLAAEAADPTKAPKQTKQQEEALKHKKEQEERKRRADAITKERVAQYRKIRARAASGLTLPMVRELTKALVLDSPDHSLPDDLIGDLYPFDDRSDAGLCAYIDQADFATVQLLLMDLIVGESLSMSHWDLDDDPRPTVLAMQAIAKQEDDIAPVAAQNATESAPRKTITLKKKPDAPQQEPNTLIVKVKKDRAAQAAAALTPAEAWPFPTHKGA